MSGLDSAIMLGLQTALSKGFDISIEFQEGRYYVEAGDGDEQIFSSNSPALHNAMLSVFQDITAAQQTHESDTPSASVGEGENANNVEGQK